MEYAWSTGLAKQQFSKHIFLSVRWWWKEKICIGFPRFTSCHFKTVGYYTLSLWEMKNRLQNKSTPRFPVSPHIHVFALAKVSNDVHDFSLEIGFKAGGKHGSKRVKLSQNGPIMNIYIYIYTYIHLWCVYIYIYVYFLCIYMYIGICICIFFCVYIYVYIAQILFWLVEHICNNAKNTKPYLHYTIVKRCEVTYMLWFLLFVCVSKSHGPRKTQTYLRDFLP